MPETTVQAELLRLQCLQALGITVYHPRFRLPGAKPSVQGPWPNADVPVVESASRVATQAPATRPVARDESAPQPAPKRMEVAMLAATTKVPAPPVPAARAAQNVAEAAADKAGAPATVQNFQLLFFQIDDDLAIVNQIPALARPQLQDKQMALLANLLRWLGKSVPAQAPRVFRWPLPGLEHMAASMNPQTSLLHFLEQAASERGFRFLLQLGPQAVTPGASAWQAFTTHSLDEMLALPSLKREVWQALLPLHEALH